MVAWPTRPKLANSSAEAGTVIAQTIVTIDRQ
jgi:hypothetical protein